MSDESQPWWQSAVVYQVYPRSFADSDGDGDGDLAGLASRIDHLVELGVDVVWLSPIYASPQDDNGYDISDYQAIDPRFGTFEEFGDLVVALHAHGIRLIMDLVVNHTSDEHPWFVESRSSRDSPKRDWYWWRPARDGRAPGDIGAEPTNWGSFFSGPAWEHDPVTGDYYLHLFSRKQPDLNWENPEVREAVYAVMRWWLDLGVDGFRMDVINLISKELPLRDGDIAPGALHGDGSPFYTSGPRIHEFLAEMHHEVFAEREGSFLTVGEMPGVTLEEARLFTDPARGEVDMVFQFEHVALDHGAHKWDPTPLDLRALKWSLGRWQAGLTDVGWNSLYWNNHDQPRAVSRFGDDGVWRERSAKALGTLLHLHCGTPFIYQGEELGMTNAPFGSIGDFRDIESINYYHNAVGLGADPEVVLASLRLRSRDNARTPMQWDDSPHAGFTDGAPWIPINPNYDEINAAKQFDDKHSVFHHYRRLVELRHTLPLVVLGDFTMLEPDDPQLYAFLRSLHDEQLLVLVNCGATPLAHTLLSDWADAELLLSNLRPEDPADPSALGPWEARVLLRPSMVAHVR